MHNVTKFPGFPNIDLNAININGIIVKHRGKHYNFALQSKNPKTAQKMAQLYGLKTAEDDNGRKFDIKVFLRKPIFFNYLEELIITGGAVTKRVEVMPSALTEAIEATFPTRHYLIGASGWSDLPEIWLRQYQIQPKSYERRCLQSMNLAIEETRKQTGLPIGIFFGGIEEYMGEEMAGIDWSLAQASRDTQSPLLGFSCPNYMRMVPDDDTPVVVAPTEDLYSVFFTMGLNFLVSTGGREVSLEHDINAAIRYDVRVCWRDVSKEITPAGVGIPSHEIKPLLDENGNQVMDKQTNKPIFVKRVANAPAAMMNEVRMINVKRMPHSIGYIAETDKQLLEIALEGCYDKVGMGTILKAQRPDLDKLSDI